MAPGVEGMEDAGLAARARAGHRDAQAALVDRFQAPLFSFLYRYTGRRADAEDLCQEVFLRAFRGLGRLRNDDGIGAWLFQIAANAAHTWRRSRRDPSGDDVDRPSNPGPDGLVQAESAEAVRRAVGSLPGRERTALVLNAYHDMSHEEIGGVMGCSPAAVSNLLYRARRRLSKKLRHLTE